MGSSDERSLRLRTWLSPVVLGLGLIAIWYAVTNVATIEAWVFPTPQAFFSKAALLLSSSWIWSSVGITALEALFGAVLGTAVALPLAWLIHRSDYVRAALEPFLGATQAIPAIAIAPMLVLWIGHGLVSIIVLCSIMVFFPVLVSTTVGLRHLDQDIIDAASLDGASGLRMIRSIEVPLVAPVMLGGIRNGFTLSVTGAVVGEMVMGGIGLGQVLVQQRYNLDTAGMFVTVTLLCVMAMALYSVIYSVERRLKRTVPSRHPRRSSLLTDSSKESDNAGKK